MKKKRENMYLYMLTLRDIEYHNQKRKKQISVMLLIFAIILIIIIVLLSKNIKELQKAKAYEEEVISYQDEQKRIEEEQRLAEEQRRKERLPQVTEEAKQKFDSIFHSETKRAFLTFDDGPSSVTPTILQTLKEKNIKATFFMLGSNVQKLPETVKQVFEEGHYIANHGYSHVYSAIYSSPQTVLDEYNQTNEAIKTAIGEPDFNSHLFRFPGGYAGGKYAEIKKQAKELLLQNEIYNIDWNCLSGDAETSQPTAEYIMNRLQVTSAEKNSIVVLMHDAQAKKITAEMLPKIIDYLAEQGYEFKTFYDIF